MFIKSFLFALGLLFATSAFAAGPNILSNTDHAASDIVSAISILSGSGIIIDQTCPTGGAGYGAGSTCGGAGSFVPPGLTFAGYAANTSQTEYTVNTATPVNHAPYGVITESSTNYDLINVDQSTYATLQSASSIYNFAFCSGSVAQAYPPVVASTILPNNSASTGTCGYASGIEFSMTVGYKGFDTSSPSGTTASMAGLLAVLKSNHPTWTWGDVKGALRQTASNWATGYAATATNGGVVGFGYGNVNYDSATAVASTSNIYLQAPGMALVNHGYYAILMLYPFLTTRRSKEVVYIGGTWPAASTGNELTAAQIAAAGGTKIVDDGGTTGVQSFTYAPAASGSATFTALTLDASGNGSRVESFSRIAASFLVGTACLQ